MSGQWIENVKAGLGPILSWIGTVMTAAFSLDSAGDAVALVAGVSTICLTWAWFVYVRAKTRQVHERIEREREEDFDED